ncbi:hypothetical protein ACFT5B_06920 [Luteimicrobium sp. NPDC057192]|uniref:hypothetical protein n=1 Tax=Luteimicrobium sp. NPDC057192 TaxID=3346042 RepID=UPI003641B9F3
MADNGVDRVVLRGGARDGKVWPANGEAVGRHLLFQEQHFLGGPRARYEITDEVVELGDGPANVARLVDEGPL